MRSVQSRQLYPSFLRMLAQRPTSGYDFAAITRNLSRRALGLVGVAVFGVVMAAGLAVVLLACVSLEAVQRHTGVGNPMLD